MSRAPGRRRYIGARELVSPRRSCGRLNVFSDGSVGVLVADMPFKCPAAPYEAALRVDSFLRKGRTWSVGGGMAGMFTHYEGVVRAVVAPPLWF